MKKKVVTVLMTAAIGIACLTGCGGSDATTKEEPVKQEETKEPEKEEQKEITYDWSTGELAKHIPLPDTDTTAIQHDDEKLYIVYVTGGTEKFNEYVQTCKDAGYTHVNSEFDGYFNAWNEDGYRLEVSLDGTQYMIQVKPSLTQGDLSWPSYGLATMVPNPEKEHGSIVVDGQLNFTAMVAEMEKDEFKAYVDKVMEMGFNVNYNRNETTLNAENANGDSIFVHYGGNKAMEVSIYKNDALDMEE